jgi:hypothetical protein
VGRRRNAGRRLQPRGRSMMFQRIRPAKRVKDAVRLCSRFRCGCSAEQCEMERQHVIWYSSAALVAVWHRDAVRATVTHGMCVHCDRGVNCQTKTPGWTRHTNAYLYSGFSARRVKNSRLNCLSLRLVARSVSEFWPIEEPLLQQPSSKGGSNGLLGFSNWWMRMRRGIGIKVLNNRI